MKLPITTTHTSYLEFDTPAYYKDKYGSHYKIYETGFIRVYKDAIINISIETKINQKFNVDSIREVLETGTPITEKEFKQALEFTYTHLNILAS